MKKCHQKHDFHWCRSLKNLVNEIKKKGNTAFCCPEVKENITQFAKKKKKNLIICLSKIKCKALL